MFYYIPKGPFFETKLEGAILFAAAILIAQRYHVTFENDILGLIFLKNSSPQPYLKLAGFGGTLEA
jgi:hypothetical protein